MTSDRRFAYVQLFRGGRNGRGRWPAHAPSYTQRTMVEKKRTGRWVEIQRLAKLCFLTATSTPQGGRRAALDVTLRATLGVRTLESATLVAATLATRTLANKSFVAGILVMDTLESVTLVAVTLATRTLADGSSVAGILVTETLVDKSLVVGILVMETLVRETPDDVTLGAATLCFLAAAWAQQSRHEFVLDFVHKAVVVRLRSLPSISVHQGEEEAFGHSNCCHHSLRWGERLQQEMRRLQGTYWFSL